MQRIVISTAPLWIKSSKRISSSEKAANAALFANRGLDRYCGAAADAWCLEFSFVDDENNIAWSSLDSLLTGIENGEMHMVNPEVLINLIKKSRMQRKKMWCESFTVAIQLGDYKEVFDRMRMSE